MSEQDTPSPLFPTNAGRRRRSRRRTSTTRRRGDGLRRAVLARRVRAKSTDRRTRVLRRLALGTVVLVVLPLLAIGGLALLVQSAFSSRVSTFAENPFPAHRGPANRDGSQNWLLMGSDTRTRSTVDLSSGAPTGQRSDTLMLVHVSPNNQDVSIVSLMRDLWVPVPGHGEAKINAALAYGGVPLVVETVEDLLDTRIQHVALVDFAGFADMSTALGGVTVESPVAFDSKNMPGFSFDEGANVVEGDRALAFVRERYSFADADFTRVRNQQAFMVGLVRSVLDRRQPGDVAAVLDFFDVTSRYVTVDAGVTARTIAGTAMRMTGLRSGAVHAATLPTGPTGRSPDGQSIVTVDPTSLAAFTTALHDDDVGRYLAGRGGDG